MQAQFHVHSDQTLDAMDRVLDEFHIAKQVFIDLGTRSDFNIPKLHSMQHYTRSIRLLGTADGYNTEGFERLHINLAKDAYRASNRRDYVIQMTTWLRRQEAVAQYSLYLDWAAKELTSKSTPFPSIPHSPRSGTSTLPTTTVSLPDTMDVSSRNPVSTSVGLVNPRKPPTRRQGRRSVYSIAAKAAFPAIPAACIAIDYEAPDFVSAVCAYLKKTCSTLSPQKLPTALDRFDVYRKMDIYLPGQLETGNREVVDRVGATKASPRKRGTPAKLARFDTVLVVKPDANSHTLGTSLSGKPHFIHYRASTPYNSATGLHKSCKKKYPIWS
jgi:hypothetical protein